MSLPNLGRESSSVGRLGGFGWGEDAGMGGTTVSTRNGKVGVSQGALYVQPILVELEHLQSIF